MQKDNVTLDKLNEMYVKTYRTLGLEKTYKILSIYFNADKKITIHYHASMLICNEFHLVNSNELFNSNKRGTRTQALIALYILLQRVGIIKEVMHFKDLTEMTYHACYNIKLYVEQLDNNLSQSKQLIAKVDKVEKQLTQFMQEFTTDEINNN